MCLACLDQHHAALALSFALLVISITLLLLSHSVPCFNCLSITLLFACSLMCFALSQYHVAHVPCLHGLSICHHASLQCSALSRLLDHVEPHAFNSIYIHSSRGTLFDQHGARPNDVSCTRREACTWAAEANRNWGGYKDAAHAKFLLINYS